MSTPDWEDLLLSIRRCDAAYIPDDTAARTAFASLGSTVIDRLQTDTNQGVLHRAPDGVLTWTDAGTLVTEGSLQQRAANIFQDVDFSVFSIGSGRHVAKQPFQEAAEAYSWIFDHAPSEPIRIEGHSLGAQKTTYAPEYLAPSRIVAMTAWESPKQYDTAGWGYLQGLGVLDRLTQVYNGEDPWALWCWFDSTLAKGTGEILWLKNGGWTTATAADLPRADLLDAYNLPHASDHDTSTLISVVSKLAT